MQSSSNLDELRAVRQFLEQEIVRQRSFDTGGENGLCFGALGAQSVITRLISNQ